MLKTARNAHLDQVRQLASGRWAFIVASVARVPDEILNGKHHPCPSGRCGSQRDGFRVFADFAKTGGSVCNQCGKHSDGFATLQWLTGQRFPEVVNLVASLLGIEKEPAKQQADPAYHLQWCDWNDSLAAMWCLAKPPIIPEAIKLAGGRMAVYRKQFKVIALPVWVGHRSNVVGWRIFNVRGKLPRQTKDKDGKISVSWVKSKLTYGSQSGVVGALNAKATELWKVEGETDLLALLSSNPRVSAICNANGAGESPTKFNWLKDSLGKASQLLIVHDADQPGQAGAVKWSSYFGAVLGSKTRVVNVELPYPIQETKGKDLRNWIAEGHSYETLLSRADKFAASETAETATPEESEDDPHRLARINLEQYERNHDGRLVFWRSEWWKYKAGRYRKIEKDELQAKVTAAIRAEFERCWRVRQEKNSEDADRPISKVVNSLVMNVIGALKSMVTQSSSVQMPSWLPDRSSRNYLSMKNGILNLDAVFSGESIDNCLLSHSPHWFSSLRLDYNFDLNATCPQWDAYLQFVCGEDIEKYNLLQEWAGYLLWPHSKEQKFLVFEGDGGTGKSSFFAAMTAMLGDENVSSLSLENFGNTFGLSSTIGKVANIAGDVGRIEGNEEAILKRYTGGDKMTIDRKNISAVEVRPTAKLMMAWNDRPHFRDKSFGLWRRMILIPLNNRIPEGNKVLGMADPSFWEAEAPGIMVWALAGLARMLEQKGFSRCLAAEEANEEYRTEANPVREFFSEYVQESSEGAIRCDVLYRLYKDWCENTGHKALNQTHFGRQVAEQTNAKKTRRSIGCVRFYQYEGINFSEFGETIFDEKIEKNFF